jgi:tetratricopeptide (TPR) repeat protein
MPPRRLAVVVLLVCGPAIYLFLNLERDRRTASQRFADALAAAETGREQDLNEEIAGLSGDPDLPDRIRVLNAVRLLHEGHADAAIEALSKVDSAGELRRPVLFYLAQALYQKKRLVEAEQVFRALTLEDSDDAEAFRWLGVVDYDLGAFAAARDALQRVIQLVPDDYRPHRLLGLMHRDFEEYADAIPAYIQAIELSPPPNLRGEILVELATCEIALRNYDAAAKHLQAAPQTAQSRALLARCFFSQGLMPQAKETLDLAKSLNPDEREVLLLDAEMASLERRPAEAIRSLRAVLEQRPYDLESRYKLGILLQQTGDLQESEAELARWRTANDLTDQLSKLNQQAASEPHNADVRDRMAAVCDQLDRPELAQMWREAAAACRKESSAGIRSAGQ